MPLMLNSSALPQCGEVPKDVVVTADATLDVTLDAILDATVTLNNTPLSA